MTNNMAQIEIHLVDANQPQEPLAGFRARIALLDKSGKEVETVFDSYPDAQGRIGLRLAVPESKEEPSLLRRIAIHFWKWLTKNGYPEARPVRDGAAFPQTIKLEVSGLDAPIHTQIIRLERGREELTVKVPVADYEKRLAAPLDEFLAGINTTLTPQLEAMFTRRDIVTLADLRRDITIEKEANLGDEDRRQFELLKSYAFLRLVSRDLKTTQALIDAGYTDLFSIAVKSQDAFVDSLKGRIAPATAARLYIQTQNQFAILRNISAENRVHLANGYASTTAFAQSAGTGETPPCQCDCQSAVSPLAYLTDLLDYTLRHATHNGSTLGPAKLTELFHQPFGDLPDDCAASETLCRQVRLCIEVLRSRTSAVDEQIITKHSRRAYDALLAELGTSRRELRLVRGIAQLQQALVERLGLTLPSTDPAKTTDRLRLASNSTEPAQKLTEENLEIIFGFQDTSRDPLSTGVKYNDEQNQLLRWRFEGVEWNYNTDEGGKIYATLIRNGSRHELKLFRLASASADSLIASGSTTRTAGEINLRAENDSGLSGRVEIRYRGDDSDLTFAVVPELLCWRLQGLHQTWQSQPAREDDLPIIDPDELAAEWIRNNRNGDAAQEILSQRAAHLGAIFTQVRLNTGTADQLKQRLSVNFPLSVAGRDIHHSLKYEEVEINAALQGGRPLPVNLERHGVTAQEAAVLIDTLRYALSGEADDEDWANAHHILTMAEKRRFLFEEWRAHEDQNNIRLSPVFFRFPTNFTGLISPPSNLSPVRARWRFSATAQRAWRDTLAARIEQQNNVVSGWLTMVDNVEERILTTFRDDIIKATISDPSAGASLAEKQDWVTNQLLINGSEGSCRKTTRVAQAIETLQILLWGLRTKNIEDRQFNLAAENFDEEWRWLGAYGSWRSAMFVFLYPESLLLPRLRSEEDQSPEFRALVKVFDGFAPAPTGENESENDSPPLSSTELAAKEIIEYLGNTPALSVEGAKKVYEFTRTRLNARLAMIEAFFLRQFPDLRRLVASEEFYYIPFHIGLTFQKNGDHVSALDWFSRVYDHRTGEFHPSVRDFLEQQVVSSPFQRYDDWLLDPLNPHLIAETRANTDLRFILISIIRCLLDYAEAEFTIDTSESLARARELYLTAHSLLRKDVLNQGTPDCPEILGDIAIRIGDDEWIPTVLTIIEDLFGTALADGGIVGLDEMIEDIKEVIDERNQLVPEVRRIRETIAGYLPPPKTGTLEGRLTASRVEEQVEVNRLLQDSEVFNTVLNARPGSTQPSFAFGLASTTSTMTTATTATLASGGVASGYVYVPAPKFAFCIPKNPLLKILKLRIAVGQFKLQNCQNIAGMRRELPAYSAPTDTQTGLPAINAAGRFSPSPTNQLRPTQYRYRILIERARQLAGIAQQMEGSYLSFLDRADQERYNLMKAGHDLEMANANVTLQDLRVAEANKQKQLAELQQTRVEFIRDYYGDLIEKGLSELETLSVVSLESAVALLTASAFASYLASGIQATYGAAQLTATSGLAGWNEIAGSYSSLAASLSTAASALSTQSSVFSMMASFERRQEEWEYQRDLAALHDLEIAKKQVDLAQAHIDIVGQEKTMALIGADHASSAVTFLQNKFTNAELYDWMSGIVGDIYRYFLQQATATAKLAQTQLAFERQEREAGFILGDYSTANSEDLFSNGNGPDRLGMTGSARLLQDMTRLDQQAFLSDRRKLQLIKTISLQRHDPVTFQQFRQSGSLSFHTSMELFDRDFPGHYLRLIKRVRVSVIALIPPTEGIKATLSMVGYSKVIRGEVFDEVDVIREADYVALTSPISATGVFELVEQPEMLLPFEGSGVEADWEFRLPKAANFFDYDTIADVLFTIEYTALNSQSYRDQVIGRLSAKPISGERPFSFRQNFADAWYDLHHPELVEEPNRPMIVSFETTRADFPPNINNLKIQEVTLYVARKEGPTFELPVTHLTFIPHGSNSAVGGGGSTVNAVISTRSGRTPSWSSIIGQPVGKWELALPDDDRVRDRFKNDDIEDILFVITFSGEQSNWG